MTGEKQSEPSKSGLVSFWAELKRRKVVRVAIVYVVVAWLLIQVAVTVFPQVGLPDWASVLVTWLLIIGFPVALIFAWAFEMTPEGLKADSDVQPIGQAVSPVKGNRFNNILLVFIALALVFLVVDQYLFDNTTAPKEEVPSVKTSGVKRAVIPLEEDQHLAIGQKAVVSGAVGLRSLALSPDGTHLVYVLNVGGTQQLYLRRMDTFEAQPLEGTEDAFHPFFSPDGQWIGFLKQGKIMKISIRGGSPKTLVDAGDVYGADWGPDNRIVFVEQDRRQVSIISGDGGEKEIILNGFIDTPEFLPDGSGILLTNFETLKPSVELFLLETKEMIPLIEGGASPKYVSTGHILHNSDTGVSAVPFDLPTYTVTGPSVPVLNDVRREQFGHWHLTLSSDGLLAYIPGEDMRLCTPVWVDRNGVEEPIPLPTQRYGSFHLSPDGSKVAFLVRGSDTDVWIYDFERATSLRRLTVGGDKTGMIWSPDGQTIAIGICNASGQQGGIFQQGIDKDLFLPIIPNDAWGNIPHSWTKDNLLTYVTHKHSSEDGDIWVAHLNQEVDPEPFVSTSAQEGNASMSPDGRYIAYTSDAAGFSQVYVKQYPPTETRWLISPGQGVHVVWSSRGDEIFYRQGQQIMSVPVQTDPDFKPGVPRVLFDGPYTVVWDSSYDVTSDGQRFLLLKPINQDPVTKIHIVANWFEELNRLVPPNQ